MLHVQPLVNPVTKNEGAHLMTSGSPQHPITVSQESLVPLSREHQPFIPSQHQ